MKKKEYAVLRMPKPGGFVHEALWLQSSRLVIDFSRECGVRVRHECSMVMSAERVRTQYIQGEFLSDWEILARADGLASIRRYDLVAYNCEHFVRELVGAERTSPQIMAGAMFGLAVSAAIATRLATL